MSRENMNKKSSSYQRKKCYQDLLTRIEWLKDKEDAGLNTVKELGTIIKEANVIDNQCIFLDRVEYADETLLESVVFSSASGILVKCFENLDIFQSTYEPAEFASKILTGITQPNEEFKEKDWLSILEDARSIVPEIPSYNFLYGSFDPSKTPVPKQKKTYKRDAEEKVEKKQLKIVENAEKDEEGIDDTVKFLYKVLMDEYKKNDSNAIPYYDFVIDSDSFSSTVENIFYSSFLVRDGKAKLYIGKDKIPTLEPMRSRDLEVFRGDGGINSQMITSINMKEWEALQTKTGFIQQHKKRKSKTNGI